jgi:hypothetical protein
MARRPFKSRRVPPSRPGIKYKNAAEALLGIKNKQVQPMNEAKFLLDEAIALIEEAINLTSRAKRKTKKGKKK